MTQFHIKSLKIDTVENTSALFQSETNAPIKWKSMKKDNQGFGEVNGRKIKIKDVLNVTDDSDFVDFT